MDTFPEHGRAPSPNGFRWKVADLMVFIVCFGLSVVLVPSLALALLRVFRPDFSIQDAASGVMAILLQGLIDVVVVGFIVVLVTVVHRRSFTGTIHWHWVPNLRAGFLITFGILLAMVVLILSSFLPTVETPIERFLRSTGSIAVFALFGIGVAPLLEEVIFRGFLFKVFSDLVSVKAAVPLTALVFAGMHVLQLWGNWGAVLLIFGVGYVLGLVRERSGSVISSWIVHTAYNGMIFGLVALGMLMGLAEKP